MKPQPLAPNRECIVVPRQVVDGLITSLHVQLDHPTRHQLKSVLHRYFYALDMDKAIDRATNGCHQCAALRHVPHTVIPQSTGDPPETVGISFAADIIKRERQLIFVVRECITSYTAACIIENERHDTLRDALICLCIGLRPLDGPAAVIRTDPAPGFMALRDDEALREYRLNIEIGRVKNKNKNPIAEKAIRELEGELLRQDPRGGMITSKTLVIATARLNSRIRSRGLSAREMLYQRDQFTNSQIPLSDHNMITEQHAQRVKNHDYSERAKAPTGITAHDTAVEIGDLVYLHTERTKSHVRDRYLVVSVEGKWCNIRKFIGQQLRSTSYRVRRLDCFKVPYQPTVQRQYRPSDTDNELSDDEAGPGEQPCQPPEPPDIPAQLSTPAHPMAYTSARSPPLVAHPGHSPMPPEEAVSVPTCPGTVATDPGCANDPHENDTQLPVDTRRRSFRSRNAPAWHGDYVCE